MTSDNQEIENKEYEYDCPLLQDTTQMLVKITRDWTRINGQAVYQMEKTVNCKNFFSCGIANQSASDGEVRIAWGKCPGLKNLIEKRLV